MCQSVRQGGRRCAAHTRPAYNAAMERLTSAKPGAEREIAAEETRAAIVEHATTTTGAAELAHAISDLQERAPSPLLGRRARHAHDDLVAALESSHRQGRSQADMHAEVSRIMAENEARAAERMAKANDRQRSTTTAPDRHRDAKARAAKSRQAALRALSGTVSAPMAAGAVRTADAISTAGVDGARHEYVVTSDPTYSTVSDPQTGALTSQVEFAVYDEATAREFTVSMPATSPIAARRLTLG